MDMKKAAQILNENGIKAELGSVNKGGKDIECIRFGSGNDGKKRRSSTKRTVSLKEKTLSSHTMMRTVDWTQQIFSK